MDLPRWMIKELNRRLAPASVRYGRARRYPCEHCQNDAASPQTRSGSIERGENSPTVSSLHQLATGLDVPITDFFQEEISVNAIHVKRAQGLQFQNTTTIIESLGIGLPNQQLEPFRMTIAPGVDNLDDPISHPGEEFVHCLEGEVKYWVGDREFVSIPVTACYSMPHSRTAGRI